jgi:serine/threonine protein phosphatase PrpC
MGMQLEFATSTDPGLDPHKRVNEDSYGQLDTAVGRLFVVCDGMGGHVGGKQASELAVATILERVGGAQADADPVRTLVAAIEEAARRVYELGGQGHNPQRPGSTCVAALFKNGYLELAHVGDSRAYMIRGKQIHRITRDHSYVQELIDSGRLSEKEAIGHPESNKITRALGMTPTVQVETRSEPLELYDGDFFVLATDGLTDLARNEDILVTTVSFTKSSGLQTACNELVALANRRGGHDNITVQVVKVLNAGPKHSRTRVEEPAGNRGPAAATVVQAPPGHTAPGMSAPSTLVDASFRMPHGTTPLAPPPFGGPMGSPPAPLAPTSEGTNPLMKVVIGMALVIGILLAALVWALKRS